MSLKFAAAGILPVLSGFGAPVQANEQIPGLGLTSPPDMAARPFAAESYKPEARGRVSAMRTGATKNSSLKKI
jgi:hypothetical protein